MRICRLAAYEANPDYVCPFCGNKAKQLITAPRVISGAQQFEAFRSPVDGSIISSRRELKEHNKRNGVQNLHDGYDQKGVDKLTKRNYQAELDKENASDLRKDTDEAIARLQDGYKPTPAPEIDGE